MAFNMTGFTTNIKDTCDILSENSDSTCCNNFISKLNKQHLNVQSETSLTTQNDINVNVNINIDTFLKSKELALYNMDYLDSNDNVDDSTTSDRSYAPKKHVRILKCITNISKFSLNSITK